MATRREQYGQLKTLDNIYETRNKAHAAAMSWIPWTKAFSWAPTLAYETISPYIYKGVSGWTGKSISTSSRANEGSQNVSATGDMYRSQSRYSKGADMVYDAAVSDDPMRTSDIIFREINKQQEIAAVAAVGYDSIKNIGKLIKSGVTAKNAAKLASEGKNLAQTGENFFDILGGGNRKEFGSKGEKANLGSTFNKLSGKEALDALIGMFGKKNKTATANPDMTAVDNVYEGWQNKMVHKQPLFESDFAKDKRYITNDVMKDMKNTQTMMNAKHKDYSMLFNGSSVTSN